MQSMYTQLKTALSQKELDLSEAKSNLDREQNNKNAQQRNSDALKLQNQELKRETSNNIEIIASLKTELERYKTKFDYAEEDIKDLRKKVSSQENQLEELVCKLREKDNLLLSSDQNKNTQIYELKNMIDKANAENELLRNQLDEAVEKVANSMSQSNLVENEKRDMLNQIETLKESKKLLQRTMSEQLTNLKIQLGNLKEERLRCDDAIKVVTVENERLQKLCENEQKRN